jgi:hypothetical protein
MTDTIQFSWLDLVRRADPDHARESRYVIEYEFTAPTGGVGAKHSGRTHERGLRVFRGNYDERGPYAAETSSDNGLTWGSIPINWNGEELTWGDD